MAGIEFVSIAWKILQPWQELNLYRSITKRKFVASAMNCAGAKRLTVNTYN